MVQVEKSCVLFFNDIKVLASLKDRLAGLVLSY